jgi:hypothetical protein
MCDLLCDNLKEVMGRGKSPLTPVFDCGNSHHWFLDLLVVDTQERDVLGLPRTSVAQCAANRIDY